MSTALAQTPESSETGVNASILIGEPLGTRLAGAELDEAAAELSSVVRCPVCQGLSIADSPVDQAGAMRAEVRELLADGFTPDQVLEYFETSYGEFIRLEPKAQGFNLVVWITPVAAVLIGAVLVAFRMRHRARGPAASEQGASRSAADPELEAYLDQVRREVGGEPPRGEAP